MGRRQQGRRAVTIRAGQLGVNLGAAGLAVANPLRGQPLAVPEDVRLGDTPEGGPAILWALPPRGRYGKVRDWGDGGTAEQAFWAFLDLAEEQDPARFLAFARRFGPLGLWPYVTPDGQKVFGLDYWVPSIPDGIRTPWRWMTLRSAGPATTRRPGLPEIVVLVYEPVSEWRRWARWSRAVVEIAYALRLGECAPRRHWEALDLGSWFDPQDVGGMIRFATDRVRQREELAAVIQRRFLRWSGLVPALRWDGERPVLTIALGGEDAVLMRRTSGQQDWPENALFPALVARLVAIVMAGEPVAACSRCDRIHPRRRKARSDQPAYCNRCRIEARRATKRESNARARADGRYGA